MDKIKAFIDRNARRWKVVRKIYLPLAMKYSAFKEHQKRNEYSDSFAKLGMRWVEESWEGIGHPRRPFTIETIATFSPISSILEIGCCAGPNLYLLGKKFPNAEIRGIDINSLAVQMGNEWLVRGGCKMSGCLLAGQIG